MGKVKPIRSGNNQMLLIRIAPGLVRLIDSEREKLHTPEKRCTRSQYIREALWKHVTEGGSEYARNSN